MSFAVTREIRVRSQRSPYQDLGVKRVRVEIDVQKIAQELGNRAWGNKGGKSTQCGGFVRVYAVKP